VNEVVLLDAGPLVALLNGRDRQHDWAKDQFVRLRPPLLSCEAVLSETLFLLRDLRLGAIETMRFIEKGILRLPFKLDEEAGAISRLLQRYTNVPMSLADACLVRMSEQHDGAVVMTFDSDFDIYRRHRREVIPTIRPGKR
jgi:predicted nucleic acid-binding protein